MFFRSLIDEKILYLIPKILPVKRNKKTSRADVDDWKFGMYEKNKPGCLMDKHPGFKRVKDRARTGDLQSHNLAL